MAMSRRALVVLLLVALAPLFWIVGPGSGNSAEAVDTPIVTSDNVELLTTVPGSATISGEFSPSAPYFYTSGLDSISVFDVSDPRNPKLTGKLANLVFENEAMSYGERRDASGKVVRRFVLVGIDLFQVSPGLDRTTVDSNITEVEGAQVQIVDVTDPKAPKTLSKTPPTAVQGGVTTSTHTVQCLSLACDYAYTAGSGPDPRPADGKPAGGFSILDLRDLANPKQVKTVESPAADKNPVFARGAGHFWDIDDSGLAWHTGSGGTAGYDISDPVNPKLLTATNAAGATTPLNDFIHHNSARPNGRSFRAGATPSLANGNVALVTEEDYANDGDEVVCDRSGTFQTWAVNDLDGAAYRAANPDNKTGKGTMTPLASFQAPAESMGGASTPVGGFCSAHWFDYHQSGIVAQGWYQQGLRLIDARDPKQLKQFGFFTGGASEVWDAYWVPARNADGTAKANREKTNIVYTADAVRGLDVFEVKDMPKAIETAKPDASTPGVANAKDPFQSPPNPAGAGAAGAGGKRCGAPTSRFRSGSALRTTRVRLRGSAKPGSGCTLRSVSVAIGRKTGKRCRYLRANGTFGPKVSCLRTKYLRAKGKSTWRFDKKVKLPRGSYLVWSRAVNSAGAVERKAKTRNLLATKVRR